MNHPVILPATATGKFYIGDDAKQSRTRYWQIRQTWKGYKKMKKLMVLSFLLFALSLICCEESDDLGCSFEDDAGDESVEIFEVQNLIADLAKSGKAVDVDNGRIIVDGDVIYESEFNLQKSISTTNEKEIEHDRNISIIKLPIITCDPFGWGPEYDWLCTMNGTKGRALGKDASEPTINDVGTYVESGSEQYPGDIASTTYFNANTYVNKLDTNVDPAAFFGLVIANFGPEWSPILEQWCTNDHIPMCIQD